MFNWAYVQDHLLFIFHLIQLNLEFGYPYKIVSIRLFEIVSTLTCYVFDNDYKPNGETIDIIVSLSHKRKSVLSHRFQRAF